MGNPLIPGCADADVFLLNDPKHRILRGQVPQNGQAVVRGAVVHANDLIVIPGKVLIAQRTDTVTKIGGDVVNRDDKALKYR